MTPEEWEALCDGCGLCCLHKLQDDDTGEIYYTNVACRLLDVTNCRCTHYTERQRLVSGCLVLTPQATAEYDWLPETCAYRRLFAGLGLEWWHPLVSGDSESVHRAGISVRGRVISECNVKESDLYQHIISFRQAL